MADESEQNLDRVLTVPNVITVVRLALMPVFLWLLFGKEDRAAAAWLLAAVGTTDFFDGYIARRFNQVSNLGKVLDPIADKLLFFLGGGAILVDGSVPTWFAVVVLAREVAVSGATLVLAAMGARRVDVNWFGKAGTWGLMMAFPLFLAHESSLEWWQGFAWLAGVPGLVFGMIGAALYIPAGRTALREGRGTVSSS